MIQFSVIIPIYNGAATLSRCLDSLLQDPRQDIELIAVDDGSTDGSRDILQAYALRDSRLKCLSLPHGGVSRARNAGMDLASGTYLTFVDCDDSVTGDYFSQLEQAPDCDLLVFGYRMTGSHPGSESALLERIRKNTPAEQQLEVLLSTRRIVSPVNKRFRRALVAQYKIRFREALQVGEDFLFSMTCALHSHSLEIAARETVLVDTTRSDSLSRRYRPDLARELSESIRLVADAVTSLVPQPEKQQRLLRILDYLLARGAVSAVAEPFRAGPFPWFQNRKIIHALCDKFRAPLTCGFCHWKHLALRLILRIHADGLIWLAAGWVQHSRRNNRS